MRIEFFYVRKRVRSVGKKARIRTFATKFTYIEINNKANVLDDLYVDDKPDMQIY